MEKELEHYKKVLRLQNGLFGAGVLAMLALMALGALQVIVPAGGDGSWKDAWNGFISGCTTSLALVMAAGIFRNVRALRDGERLRKLYIKTHDERTREIFQRAGSLSYWFDAFGMLVAAVVAGYFNPAAALACLGCTMYVCLVRLALKLYYHQTI